jgi:hypothetical protein
MTSFAFAGSVQSMNDIVGDITGTGGVGNLRKRLLVFRELIVVVVVVVNSSGESNTENHNAVLSSVVACLRVARHFFTHTYLKIIIDTESL